MNSYANPAPLGLTAFGMTTVLLNLHNAGFFPIDSMLLAMGIFYGGLGQVFAGLLCFKRGDTFGTTAFTSFGLLAVQAFSGYPALTVIAGYDGIFCGGLVIYLAGAQLVNEHFNRTVLPIGELNP